MLVLEELLTDAALMICGRELSSVLTERGLDGFGQEQGTWPSRSPHTMPFPRRIVLVLEELLTDAALMVFGWDILLDRFRQETEEEWYHGIPRSLPLPLPVMVASFIGLLTCPASGSAGTVLASVSAGLSLTSKTALIASGVSLLLGGFGLWDMHKHSPDFHLHRLVAFACFFSGVSDLALLAGLPAGLAWSSMASAHIMKDVLVAPMYVVGVGYLSGLPACSKEVLPCIVLSVHSVAAYAGAASVSSSALAWALLIGGTMFLLPVAVELTQNFPRYAMCVSAVNAGRVHEISEAVVFGFSVRPAMQALYMLDFLTDSELLVALVASDAIVKLGAGHMMLKNRLALLSVANHQERAMVNSHGRLGLGPPMVD